MAVRQDLGEVRKNIDSAAVLHFGYPHRSEARQVEDTMTAIGEILRLAGIENLSIEAIRGLAIDAISRTGN